MKLWLKSYVANVLEAFGTANLKLDHYFSWWLKKKCDHKKNFIATFVPLTSE